MIFVWFIKKNGFERRSLNTFARIKNLTDLLQRLKAFFVLNSNLDRDCQKWHKDMGVKC